MHLFLQEQYLLYSCQGFLPLFVDLTGLHLFLHPAKTVRKKLLLQKLGLVHNLYF